MKLVLARLVLGRSGYEPGGAAIQPITAYILLPITLLEVNHRKELYAAEDLILAVIRHPAEREIHQKYQRDLGEAVMVRNLLPL